MAARDRRRQALAKALTELGSAFAMDTDVIWVRTRIVLDWLYHCEEAEKTLDTSYYVARNADSRGKALAGLIWVRGLVVHHQAEVESLMFTQETSQYKLALTAAGARVQSAEAMVATWVWPTRSALPVGRTEKQGRDIAYDECVANKPLLQPLEQAVSYLLSLP